MSANNRMTSAVSEAKSICLSSCSFQSQDPSPGPGSYNVRQFPNKTSIHYQFANRLKDLFHPCYKVCPGPDAYSPNYNSIKQKYSFDIKIGNAIRKNANYYINAKNDLPGPTSYLYAYQTEKNKKQMPKYSLSHSRRKLISEEVIENQYIKTPGAKYNLPNCAIEGPKFNKQYKIGKRLIDYMKLNKQLNTSSPGPAQYYYASAANYVKDRIRAPGMPKDERIKSIKQHPGPGDYEISREIGKGPKFGFGTSKRNVFSAKNTKFMYSEGSQMFKTENYFQKVKI